jgi:hypothetical protein
MQRIDQEEHGGVHPRGRIAMNKLYVTAGFDQLLAYGGEPVLPIADAQEQAVIERAASIHRVELAQIARERCQTVRDAAGGAGTIVAIGPEALPAARLYAHLTGSKLVPVTAVDKVAIARGPAVIIASYAHWSDELAERCSAFEREIGTIPGMILAPDRRRLLVAAKKHAVALRRVWSRPAGVILIATVPTTLSAAEGAKAGIRVVGPNAGAEEVRQALAGPTDLLAVFTHGDGIDSPLPSEMVLCPYTSEPIIRDGLAGGACLKRRICHRTGKSIEDARASGRLVDAHSVAAGAVVYIACSAVMLNKLGLDDELTLGHVLLSTVPGPVICPIDLPFPSYSSLITFFRTLGECGNLGTAIAEFNTNPENRLAGLRLFLFGDPRCSLPVERLPVRSHAQIATGAQRYLLLRRAGTLRLILYETARGIQSRDPNIQSRDRDAAKNLVTNASKTLRQLENELLNRDFDLASAAIERCDRLVTDLVQCHFTGNVWWARWAPPSFADIDAVCRHCGASARTAVCYFGNGIARNIESCRSCGLTLDGPDEEPFFQATIQQHRNDIVISLNAQTCDAAKVTIQVRAVWEESISIRTTVGRDVSRLSVASIFRGEQTGRFANLNGFVDVRILGCRQLALVVWGRCFMFCDVAGAMSQVEALTQTEPPILMAPAR